MTYLGSRHNSLKAVETDLLRRAAQVTLNQGYDWFYAADREGVAYYGR